MRSTSANVSGGNCSSASDGRFWAVLTSTGQGLVSLEGCHSDTRRVESVNLGIEITHGG
jgi:hypothetical protein